MPKGEAGTLAEALQHIGHGGLGTRRSDTTPSVHELSRRSDYEILPFQRIGLAIDEDGGTPAAAHPHIAATLCGVEDALSHPPIDDLFRRQRLEHPLRGGGDLDACEDQLLVEIGDGACTTLFNSHHVPSRLRLSLVRLACQKVR